MSGTILVTYGTKHGSTREVADIVAETLAEHGLAVETLPAAHVDDVSPYAGVVLGGAIYMGRWHPDAVRFLDLHRDSLVAMPVAIFGMGPRTLEPRDADASRAQLIKALSQVPEVDPCALAVFGGVIDPYKLRFPFNRFPESDARDWSAIRTWATQIADVFGKAAAMARDHRRDLQQTPR